MEKDIKYYYDLDKQSVKKIELFYDKINDDIYSCSPEELPYVVSMLARQYMTFVFSDDIERSEYSAIRPCVKMFSKDVSFKNSLDRNRVMLKLGKDEPVIVARKLTSRIPEIYAADKDFDSYQYRYEEGVQCHTGSSILARALRGDSEVVTGFIYGNGKDVPFSHSWVERTIDGMPCCIDYNANAILEKRDFYRLNRITEILSKIPWKTIECDVNHYWIKDSKEYMILREQTLAKSERKQVSEKPSSEQPSQPSNS